MSSAKVHKPQGGDKLVVEDGGLVDIRPGGMVVAGGEQAGAIADLSLSGTYGDDDTAIEGAINSILSALRGVGIIAES